MKKGTMVLLALVLFWPLLGKAEEEGYYSESFARLSFVKGEVYVERANELGTESGIVNLALVEGDKLVTQAGRAEVHFGKKNYLRLDSNTEVEFSVMPREGDNRVRLHLLAGSVYLRISRLQEEKTFEIHTPDASFYILEEGLYRLDMLAGGETVLSVVEGSVEAAGEAGSQLVESRQSLVASNGQLGSEMGLSLRRDDFDSWNQDRDSLLRQYASQRYLPAELEDYEGELESHGYWIYERPYGYVWVPFGIYADWRPYFYGRWVWYPVCGWTWVSYEPWGWCVYHYGRWHWRLGLGWYWIPTRYWGPAWVHWYWGYDYIGWCPLSWYNRPIVIVNNYFYDRYHHSYYPAHSRALTVVHRSQLQAPDISRIALSHVEASRLGQINLQARQPDIKPTVSRLSLAGSADAKSIRAPQIHSAPKSLTPSSRKISSRSSSGLASQRARVNPGSIGSEPMTKGTAETISRTRGIPKSYPAREELKSTERSFGSVVPAPRRMKSDSSTRGSSSSSPGLGRVKSSSFAPSLSPPVYPSRNRTDPGSEGIPRIYAPRSTLSRPQAYSPSGPKSFPSSFRHPRGTGPISSTSSPPSFFRAPSSFSPSRSSSPSFSLPRSTFRSSPSFSSSPPTRSSPSPSSSPSRTGRVVRKNN
ncbi:MAG: DUF6600 domain-containing protein [Candidatus Aminicenantales bacterium]